MIVFFALGFGDQASMKPEIHRVRDHGSTNVANVHIS